MKRLRPLLGILPLLGLCASALSAQAPAGESFGEVVEDGKPVALTNR
jgi:hypothetical protein